MNNINFPKKVKLVEVSPRDGLQNEKTIVSTADKITFINMLSNTGLSVIEATSFVSKQKIPALADHEDVFQGIEKKAGINYPVLIPNIQGLTTALNVGVKEIAIFTTPSEKFSQHNTNCTVAESLERIKQILEIAKQHHLPVRAYISCVLGCPYEGEITPEKVVTLALKLHEMGCYEISLGDTIGVGTPFKTQQLLLQLLQKLPKEKLAVHFHDTYGQALVNIYAALALGISIIDSSVAGLGGCPYARGASGNVATEEVLYMLNGMGIETGVNMQDIIAAGEFISAKLNRLPQSKVSLALKAKN